MSKEQPLRTAIERSGQKYLDNPVYETVSKAKPLSYLVNAMAGGFQPDDYGVRTPGHRHVFGKDIQREPHCKPDGWKPLKRRIEHISGYEHVQLRWLVPDGKGGLVPKKR